MKKLFIIPLVAAVMASCGGKQGTEQPLSVNIMTYNIRYDNPEDSLNNWQYRKDRAANAIEFYQADIVGTQEVLHHQLQDLKERLPEFTAIGVARDDGKEDGEYNVLFYRTNKFDELESGTFWLSETPDEPSRGWDGACNRVATWARLKDKNSGKEILAVNTHLDHRGREARREGVNLLFNKINELSNGAPVIVTGDFNADPDSEVIKHITNPDDPNHLTHSREIAAVVYGPNWSWHDFGKIPYEYRSLIDYIFVRGDVEVDRYGVLAETENGEFLSDHSPVLATVTLK